SVYVFVRAGVSWSEQQKLHPSDGSPGDRFGWSVSISGDTVVVGAPFKPTTFGAPRAGAVYVFVRSGTTWGEQQKLLGEAQEDHFGTSVSLSGQTVVIGAPDDDLAAGYDAGSAFVFVRSGTTWTQQQKLAASDMAAVDHFGSAVS